MKNTAILLLLLTLVSAAAAQTGADRPGRWFGADGRPLPFTTEGEVLEFLAGAEVVASEPITGSSNRPMRLTLEKDGVRARAIFRTVDAEGTQATLEHARGFRDSYLFEIAAFELSRLLGLDNVPPATLRTIGRQDGSIQLWVEQALGVAARMEQGIDPNHEKLWLFQKQNMAVFDNLVYNFDRNPGNVLIDVRGRVWFVDHTRSFKILPSLPNRGAIKVCERRLYDSLRDLDPKAVRQALEPYVGKVEIGALIKRRAKLVKAIDRQIAKHGEKAILFEFVKG